MKILVTGHQGFIGKNMMPWINAEGWEADGWDWQQDEFPDVKNYNWVIHLGAITNEQSQDVERILTQFY